MDKTTEHLVSYAAAFSDSVLTDTVKQITLNHLVDTVACAIAGFDSEPARITTRIAKQIPAAKGATIIGDGTRVAAGEAAFCNTTMVRTYDWNDGMFAKGGGHPSDMIAAILAIGEVAGSTPREVLTAIVLAYEFLGALGDTTPLRAMEWDQGTFMAPSCALAIGKLLGLTEAQLGHAVALSIVPQVPLFVTRVGAISMWKGCATGASMRNAIFGVLLAKEGMTAANEPFEGKSGLWEKVTGPFEVNLPANPDAGLVVEMSYMKRYPSELHSQAMIGLAPKIASLAGNIDDIASMDMEVYWHAWDSIGRGAVKWDPDTRETADHSLPYLFSVALVDGEVTRASFTPERIADPALRPIMNKITIRENEEFTAQFRPPGMEILGSPRARITVTMNNGSHFVEEVTYAKGHALNPMHAEDINTKLDEASAGVISDDKKEQIRETWWNLEKLSNIGEAIATLANF